jgi:hypothetical protein
MRLTSEKQIPSKIHVCAQVNHLGVPRIMYEPCKPSRLHLFLGPFAILVGLLILALYQVYYDRVFSWWPTWQRLVVPGISFAWLLIGLWTLLAPLASPHRRLYLCPKGLIYVRRNIEVIRWDKIALLYKELYTADESAQHSSPLKNYTLLREDGKHFVLSSDLPYLDRLGGFIEREITRYLLAGSIASYEANLAQSFGVLLVDRRGIMLRETSSNDAMHARPQSSRLLPWSEFERVTLDETTLNLYRRGERWAWATLSVSGLPNLYVFKGLTEHIVKNMHIHMHLPITEPPVIEQPARPSQFAAFDAGLPIYFGVLSVSKEGVSMNKGAEVIPWEEIASFGLGESEVMLKRIGSVNQWYTVPLWTISDLPLLRQLVDYAFYRQFIQ